MKTSERFERDLELYNNIKDEKAVEKNEETLERLKYIVTQAIYQKDEAFLSKARKWDEKCIYSVHSLIAASEMDNIGILSELLINEDELGDDAALKSIWRTAFNRAAEKKNYEVLGLLLSAQSYLHIFTNPMYAVAGNDIEIYKILLEKKYDMSLSDFIFTMQLKNQPLVDLLLSHLNFEETKLNITYDLNNLAMLHEMPPTALNLQYFKKVVPHLKNTDSYKSWITRIMIFASALKNHAVIDEIMSLGFTLDENNKLRALQEKWGKYPDIDVDPRDQDELNIVNDITEFSTYPYSSAEETYNQFVKFPSASTSLLLHAIILDDHNAMKWGFKLCSKQSDTTYGLPFMLSKMSQKFWHATLSDKARHMLLEQSWFSPNINDISFLGDIHYFIDRTFKTPGDEPFYLASKECYQKFKLANSDATRALQALSCVSKMGLRALEFLPLELVKVIYDKLVESVDMMKPPYVYHASAAPGKKEKIYPISNAAKINFYEKLKLERSKITAYKDLDSHLHV